VKANKRHAYWMAVRDLELLDVRVEMANVASRGVATLSLGAKGTGPREIVRLEKRGKNLVCLRLVMRELVMKNIGVGCFVWRLRQVRRSVRLLRALTVLRRSLPHPNRSEIYVRF
jgi:hypothetical protein